MKQLLKTISWLCCWSILSKSYLVSHLSKISKFVQVRTNICYPKTCFYTEKIGIICIAVSILNFANQKNKPGPIQNICHCCLGCTTLGSIGLHMTGSMAKNFLVVYDPLCSFAQMQKLLRMSMTWKKYKKQWPGTPTILPVTRMLHSVSWAM
jgi:hypothetical protein